MLKMQSIKGIGRRVKRKLRESQTRILRRIGILKSDWSGALPEEALFWEKALTDPEHCWVIEDYRYRTNPDSELQPELKQLIDAPAQSVVRILDVGAGPLTRVGKRWAERTVEITAVDPLADAYKEMLARIGLKPLVETVPGDGEKLLEQFRENEFDLAYASNALDHSYDPLMAINQMFAVIKPGRFVYLWHFANEGLQEGYSGLHQWNFDVQSEDFLISDGRKQLSLMSEFRHRANVRCEVRTEFNARVVIAKLQKLPK